MRVKDIFNYSDEELFAKVQNNLVPNQEVKNYKALCTLLEIPVLDGRAKKFQLTSLGRFFEYERIGNKYIITKILDEPLEKNDLRIKGNHSIYVTYIESILLNYFITKGKVQCSFTRNNLWQELGMINDNYNMFFSGSSMLKKLKVYDYRINQWQLNNFYQRTRAKFNDILKCALNNLQNRKLIEFRECVWARKTCYSNGRKKYFEVKKSTQKAVVMECEKEALNALNCRSIQEVIYSKDKNVTWDKYCEIRNTFLYDKLGWDFVYKKFSIVCNQKFLAEGLRENNNELLHYLNAEVIKATDAQADEILRKNREALKEGTTTFRYPNYYPEVQKKLSKKLLDIDVHTLDCNLDEVTDAEILYFADMENLFDVA